MKNHLFGRTATKSSKFLTVIDRMIGRDIVKTLLTVLSILILVIVTRRFLSILSKAIAGELSGDTLFTVLGLKVLSTASILIPPAIFLSVLMVLGRMYKDNEMTILAASGFGTYRIFRAVLLSVVPISLVAAFFSMAAAPWADSKIEQIMAIEKSSADIRGISAGKFNEYSRGDLVFYVENITASNRMENIFVQHRQHGKLGVIASESGYVKAEPSGATYMVLQNGYRYEGSPGNVDYSVTKFGEYAVLVDQRVGSVSGRREAVPSLALWHSPVAKDQAELQKRISIPLGTLILSMLAVPLARIAPGGGVYGNFITAILIYFVYENLLGVGHSWIVQNRIPQWVGVGWVYFLMVCVIVFLVIKAQGLAWMFGRASKRAA